MKVPLCHRGAKETLMALSVCGTRSWAVWLRHALVDLMRGHETETFQTCWSYTSKLLYPSRFLVLDLMPVPVVHISDRKYVGGWIASCLPPTRTLSFFPSCGAEVTLMSKTVLNRSGAERCKNESALCCGEEVQFAINRTWVISWEYRLGRFSSAEKELGVLVRSRPNISQGSLLTTSLTCTTSRSRKGITS